MVERSESPVLLRSFPLCFDGDGGFGYDGSGCDGTKTPSKERKLYGAQ